VREDVYGRAARLAKREAPDSPLLVAQGIGDLEPPLHRPGVTASTSSTSTEMPGAAGSSLPTMVTWAEGLVGEATVTTQPRSIATSKPSSSTKKSRVSTGRSDPMFGTVRSIVPTSAAASAKGLARRCDRSSKP
jgi:hypothetical protein